jgi:hypothetical protein
MSADVDSMRFYKFEKKFKKNFTSKCGAVVLIPSRRHNARSAINKYIHTMKSFSTTTREIFTPSFDRFTGGKFKGNHHDMMVIFERNNDNLNVTIVWAKNSAGMFNNRSIEKYSVSSMVKNLRSDAEDMGLLYSCDDNIPNGVSYPQI